MDEFVKIGEFQSLILAFLIRFTIDLNLNRLIVTRFNTKS